MRSADLRFDWLQRQASGDIVVVAIDAPSIEKIGVWPWPRRLHAELLRQLEKAGVRDIAFDVDFSAPSDAASDRDFAEALQGAGGSVVLPCVQATRRRPATGCIHVNRPLKPFADQSWAALVNVDGRARWPRPPLSVRREARRRVLAVDGGGAGRTIQQQATRRS